MEDGVDDALPVIRLADVEVVVGGAVDRGGDGVALRVEDVGEGDGGTLGGEETGLGGALSTGGAGDEGDASLQAAGHGRSLRPWPSAPARGLTVAAGGAMLLRGGGAVKGGGKGGAGGRGVRRGGV